MSLYGSNSVDSSCWQLPTSSGPMSAQELDCDWLGDSGIAGKTTASIEGFDVRAE